jgi:hypothetical protein
MERIEKERLTIPVAAFQFWEQNDFNTMLKEIMDSRHFTSSNQKRKNARDCTFID